MGEQEDHREWASVYSSDGRRLAVILERRDGAAFLDDAGAGQRDGLSESS